jgi:MFS family permease
MTELLLDPARRSATRVSIWKDPSAWLREKNLSCGYWVFFAAAFFFDAGFSIYFFLFNLYLLDCHFNERAMGWIGGAMTLGTLLGTLPAGTLTQKIGVRPLLIGLFISAPIINAVRAVWIWEPAQIGLAFLTGLSMCSWGVCFLPAVARLTTEKSRTAGFSLIFSVGVGTSMLGGIVCGYLRQWLGMAGIAMQPVDVKRLILLASCGVVLAGLIPVLRLRMPAQAEEEVVANTEPERKNWLRRWNLRPFLVRFLPLMALWSAVLAAFTPFANVYLERNLRVPMTQIGLIFSTVQVIQLCMGLVTPIVFRALGLMNGIAVTQIGAAAMLGCLAMATNQKLSILLYLTFSAAQWMSAPGLYNLLMDETPDKERGTAAALTMFWNALFASAATAGAGVLLTRFGYPPVLLGLAVMALTIAVLLRFLISPQQRPVPALP